MAPPTIGSTPSDLPGVPFYSHYGVCTQETVWLEPQAKLSLTVIADNNPPITRTMTLNGAALSYVGDDQDLSARDLVAQLASVGGKHDLTKEGASLCPNAVAAHWKAISEYQAYQVVPMAENRDSIGDAVRAKNLVEVANTSEIGTAVDYSKVYYLNSRSPWIGTSSVDAKLADDGTLGEGSVSTDDETWATVLNTIATLGGDAITGFTTLGAAKITGAATVEAAKVTNEGPLMSEIVKNHKAPPPPVCAAAPNDYWPEVKQNVEYAFTVTPGGFKHDHKKVSALVNNDCTAAEVYDGSFTVTPVVAGGDKPDKGAIGVTGTITLPKPDAKAKK